MKKTLMITLTEAQFQELERLSNWLGASKSRVIQQALMVLAADIKEVSNNALDKVIH